MKTLIFLLAAVCSLSSAVGEKYVVEADRKEHSRIATIIRGIMEQQWEERRYLPKYNTNYYQLTLLGFSWSNCGSASDPIQVHSLSVSPDPIVIPGEETVSFDINLATDITSPTKIDVKVQKKLFGVFIDVPCIDNIGSCTYNDPCSLLKNITCPPVFKEHNIPCQCPFPKGETNLPASVIQIPKINLPSIVENGEYKISGTLYQGSTRLGCYEVDASLKQA